MGVRITIINYAHSEGNIKPHASELIINSCTPQMRRGGGAETDYLIPDYCNILMAYSKISCLLETEYNPQTSGSTLQGSLCFALQLPGHNLLTD